MFSFLISILGSWQYDRKKYKVISIHTKTLYCILITLPIIILQGLRYGVGTDYFSYLSLYKGFGKGNTLFLRWYQTEPLFVLFCRTIYIIADGNDAAFFLADAILMNFLLFLTFDYYKDQINLPIMYFFYYMLCLPYFLNAERQGLAVIITWYATKYVHENKTIKFLICILIAALFHNTAIVALVFYSIKLFQGKYGKYIKNLFIVFMICLPFTLDLIINFASNYLSIFRKYRKFLTNDVGKIEHINVNLLYMAFMIMILLFFINIIKTSRVDYIWILFLWIAQLISYLLNNYIEWGFRMSFYFEFGMMFAYSFVYARFRSRINRIALLSLLMATLLFYFTYKFYIQGNGEIFPYQFIKSHG